MFRYTTRFGGKGTKKRACLSRDCRMRAKIRSPSTEGLESPALATTVISATEATSLEGATVVEGAVEAEGADPTIVTTTTVLVENGEAVAVPAVAAGGGEEGCCGSDA